MNGNLANDWEWTEGPDPGISEAYAVSWRGSVIGVAGYVIDTNPKRYAYVAALTLKGKSATYQVLDQVNLGYVPAKPEYDYSFNCVVVSGPKVYAAGYGPDGTAPKAAMVAAYDPKATVKRLWLDTFGTYYLNCMGMTAAKTGVYVAGIQDTGVPGEREWWVRAYNLDGTPRWEDWFLLNSGIASQTYGIAASSSSIVAVGWARDGLSGPYDKVLRAYAP